jgi:hypothetical protein
LLTQAPQDWQFDLTPDLNPGQNPSTNSVDVGLDWELKQALQSGAGPRLVASGLALKVWLR